MPHESGNSFLEQFLDANSLFSSENKRWPTVKTTIDVLRAFPIAALFGVALNAIATKHDAVSQITFWVFAPVALLVFICATLQLSALLIIFAFGLLSHLPPIRALSERWRTKDRASFAAWAALLAVALFFPFLIVTVRLVAALPLGP